MATNALKYIKNVGKSVTYASVGALKELNPVFNQFAEDNKEVVNNVYKTIRNLNKTAKKMPKMFKDSEYGRYSSKLLNNLKEDLKTGKLYNKERINKMENEAFGFGDDEFGFGQSFRLSLT